MDDYAIQNALVELRFNAWVTRPSNAGLALSLIETRDAIQQTQEKIERSDRLIASLAMVLCWQSPSAQIEPSAKVARSYCRSLK
jgi:hypothetical protein